MSGTARKCLRAPRGRQNSYKTNVNQRCCQMKTQKRKYRIGSLWNDLNELRCYLAYRKLERDGFPRGYQAEICHALSEITGLSTGNLSAKICNYKSVAGDNNQSNASANTKYFVNAYAEHSISQLETIVAELAAKKLTEISCFISAETAKKTIANPSFLSSKKK